MADMDSLFSNLKRVFRRESLAASELSLLQPRIVVLGVGGAGGNAINNMIRSGTKGLKFVSADADAQALQQSLCSERIQLGPTTTGGLGSGAKPEIGAAAAEEVADDILRHIRGSQMVFITAGMGGGTGTGASPAIARLARDEGILTVGVVTQPFEFEGMPRMNTAVYGVKKLAQEVDTLIVIPNQNLLRMVNNKITLLEAFRLADDILLSGVQGLTDFMVNPGHVNLDFADIRRVMCEMGQAMMGIAEASGAGRAKAAATLAISNPLFSNISLERARAVVVNIAGGHETELAEVNDAVGIIRDAVNPEADLIYGSSFSGKLDGRMRVTIFATGIAAEAVKQEPRRSDAGSEREARSTTDRVTQVATEKRPVHRTAKEEKAKRMAQEDARRAAEETTRKAEEEARQAVEGIKRKAEAEARHAAEEAWRKAEEQAQLAAEEAGRKAEERARWAAEEAKSRVEAEAKQAADEVKRRAQEEAKQATEEIRRKAEADARRIAEVTKRKAETEAMHVAEESRLKAEAEAKRTVERVQQKAAMEIRKAEEEIRKAEAEARRITEESKRKAEAEAKQAAEEIKRKSKEEARLAAEETRRKAEVEAKQAAEEIKRRAEKEARRVTDEAERKAAAAAKRIFEGHEAAVEMGPVSRQRRPAVFPVFVVLALTAGAGWYASKHDQAARQEHPVVTAPQTVSETAAASSGKAGREGDPTAAIEDGGKANSTLDGQPGSQAQTPIGGEQAKTLKAEEERLRAEAAKLRAEKERLRTEAAKLKAEEVRLRAEEATRMRAIDAAKLKAEQIRSEAKATTPAPAATATDATTQHHSMSLEEAARIETEKEAELKAEEERRKADGW